MDSLEIPYAKFKILFVNIFFILFKAATLNPNRLQSDLRETRNALQKSGDAVRPWLTHILILLVSLLLMAKFLFGYLSLAANVIAIFPILTEEQPDLLLPAIICQAVENILLSLIEILLAYVTVKFYIPCKMSLFALFMTKMIIKMSLSISTLNVYSNLYGQLKFPTYSHSETSFHEGEETFINKQSLV